MILIYLPTLTPRCEYVFDFVFREQMGILYTATNNTGEFDEYQGVKISYSDHNGGQGLSIRQNGLLTDVSIKIVRPDVANVENIPVLFPDDSQFGFDVFSAVFFMLSRYEEHLPFQGDMHGRFPATESLAFKNNFLEIPVVDAWVTYLKEKLVEKFPKTSFRKQSFSSVMTYDIDIAYKYIGRNFSRSAGSFARDALHFRLKEVINRLLVLSGILPDPWDIYDHLLNKLNKEQQECLFFIPTADAGEYDRNQDVNQPKIEALVKKIYARAPVGIHPSYVSKRKPKKIAAEKERLESVISDTIVRSRQHYINIGFPNTYLELLKAGIREDYSMIFPDRPGFRAGTCHPFRFFDLKNEQLTALRIFPAVCMDATYIYYLKTPASKSLANMLSLLKTIKRYNGVFISIWHNDHLEKGSDWEKAHDQLLKQIRINKRK